MGYNKYGFTTMSIHKHGLSWIQSDSFDFALFFKTHNDSAL